IIEQAEGPEHASLTGPLNNLALLYVTTGQYDKADPLFQRTITLTEQTMGKDHFRVERALRNYATLLRKIGRTGDAVTQETRANAIHEKNNPT
ncbi:MAG: tetratricopeptide repeat protein, partial [Nitrospira sp.]|nr:tetratricopeptide repeat protein [Nitrospira sp.]